MATGTGFGRVKYFDDFLGVAIDVTNDWNGVGSNDTIAVSAQNNGAVRLTTHTDDNDHSSIRSMLVVNPSHGGCLMEARVTKVTDSEGRGFFIGFTDDATTDEEPITLTGTTFTTTAANAVGFVFDTDATTDVIYGQGVKTNTDSDTLTTAVGIAAAGTWQTFRVEIWKDGNAVFYIDGVEVGRIANAVTANTDLCANVTIKNSDAAAASMDVDYVYFEGGRE